MPRDNRTTSSSDGIVLLSLGIWVRPAMIHQQSQWAQREQDTEAVLQQQTKTGVQPLDATPPEYGWVSTISYSGCVATKGGWYHRHTLDFTGKALLLVQPAREFRILNWTINSRAGCAGNNVRGQHDQMLPLLRRPLSPRRSPNRNTCEYWCDSGRDRRTNRQMTPFLDLLDELNTENKLVLLKWD